MNKLIKTKWFTLATYLLLVLATLLVGFVLLHNNKTLNKVISSFFEVAENRSFDYRQSLRVLHKQPIPNKDILIVAVDEASLEKLWEKYGEWPFPRKIYADVVEHMEKDHPQAIIFDFMFMKSMKNESESDAALIKTLNSYDNVYTGMNFDGQTADVRTPIDLPERLAINLENNSKIDISQNYGYTNCRGILPELLDGNVNVGITNVMRSNDGIMRKIGPLLEYKGKYYPFLSFGAASNYILGEKLKTCVIDKNNNMKIQDTVLPLTKDGDVILNWYGISGTHAVYPLYKVIEEIEGKNIKSKMDYNDKIIIIGTTAMSLHDTKSVPVQEGVYPGVEVHATFFNNILDNNFIKKSSLIADIAILVVVIAIVGAIVMFSTSTIFALLSTILFTIAYLFISYYVMELYNLWIPVVIPSILITFAFALSFLTKYIIKSRDFEYQYKLATIDGLTELYNHRYFQETLQKQLELAKRYDQNFSLIILDIDFFKKFNDTYGHQAGDAVLKQVAQILKKNSRTTDFVCRYGGEEMSIILPNTSADEALFLANRINKAIANAEFQLGSSEKGKVTISVGVATYPENAETAQDLIEFADKGLYYAKEHGRNQVQVYKA